MKYIKEKQIIIKAIKTAFNKFVNKSTKTYKKSKFDIVTEIDINIEKYLSKSILQNFPEDKIYGEETHKFNCCGKRVWTIDPIDGTFNMKRGIPLYGIQCSLIENNEIVLGVIYLPIFNKFIYAIKNQGCFCDNKKLKVSDIDISELSISFGDYPHNSAIYAKKQLKCIEKIYDKVAKIRTFGSSAVDFALIAMGMTGGSIVLTENIWDLAPGILICKEAGAIVTNSSFKPYKIGDYGVIVANNKKTYSLFYKNFKI